jgi:hypothetical protein
VVKKDQNYVHVVIERPQALCCPQQSARGCPQITSPFSGWEESNIEKKLVDISMQKSGDMGVGGVKMLGKTEDVVNG